MEKLWVQVIDVACSAVVLRILFGWLILYRRLARLLVVLAALLLTGLGIAWLRLPFASLLSLVLIPPLAVLAFLAFLPDLNRIYQSASRGNVFGTRLRSRPELVPELCTAVMDLARRRIGALLVFPQQDPVGSWISGGEDIDARFNHSLLVSLLNPHCPRHDGAVIIQGDRITKAGAVLPLASADGQDNSLGTRHLAAMGLTERCDADVLVVSEERGTISHSRNGKIGVLPSDDRAQLEESLTTILGPESAQKRAQRIGNLSALLWAMAVVVATLGTVVASYVQERVVVAPEVLGSLALAVTVQDVAEPLYVESISNPTVRVFVRGNLERALAMPLTAVMNLRGYGKGAHRINLQPDMIVGLPREVEVERFDPESVEVILAEARRLNLRVAAPTIHGIAPGLELGPVSYSPSRMEVLVKDGRFPRSGVLATRPVDVSDVTEPGKFVRKTTLDVPGSIQALDGQSLPPIEVTIDLRTSASR
ncbi:MAG: diadenylate cyclase CdaA [Candidatus Methylacidiphilales bacterium]